MTEQTTQTRTGRAGRRPTPHRGAAGAALAAGAVLALALIAGGCNSITADVSDRDNYINIKYIWLGLSKIHCR